MRTVTVTLLPGQTLTALIRLHNAHAMKVEDVARAMVIYNELNPGVATAGRRVQIPVLPEYERVTSAR
jgi:hypothetical protein